MKYTKEIRFVIERLEAAGHEAYLVGGALRDALLGREANDFDVTTSATPAEMKAVFADEKTVETGLKHGTLTVLVDRTSIEVTTFRVDGEYLDARHPQSVRFTRSLAEDLARRDFTVNAMAYNEKTGLVDLYGGKEDLARGLIRAVGEPALRFREDALRILRAFRFSAKLGFAIEEKTLAAARECREGLRKVSAERVSAELRGILMGKDAHRALALMDACGVLSLVLPEARVDERIASLSACFEMRLAFLLRGVEETALAARLYALRLSNAEADAVKRLVREVSDFVPCESAGEVRRLMAKTGALFEPLLEILAALGVSVDLLRDTSALCRARGDCLTVKELAVDGRDLLALGIKGRAVGETLEALLERVLDDPSLNERETLLSLVK
ncbi:MAG: CCA tRNA nucleotidyltransferase [Ruminococcaceae bacterium]|nr:CCA tRNA nucleotidyltransferase [Oscillospiraceae bacterium]